MDGSESMSCSPEPGKGTEAEAVVVTATATPSPVSELSPAALPASSSSVEATAKPPSPALPPTPTPVPPRCLGARGYDGGFYDVGSFFVFRHEPQQQQRAARDETPASAEEACGGDIVELFGAGPAVPGTAAAVVRSPLQFELLDGLAVRCAAAMGGKDEVNGSGPETAARAFVVLQRQVKILGQALGCADGPLPKAKKAGGSSSDGESDSKGQDESRGAGDSNGAVGVAGKDAENGVVAANGSNEKEPSQQQQQQGKSREELFALSNTDDNDSLQGLVRSGGCVWIGKFGLPPMPPGKDESEVVDLWPRKVTRVVGGGEDPADPAVVVRALEGKPDAVGPLTVCKEESGGGEEGEVAGEVARRTHELIVQALADLRPHVPPALAPLEERQIAEGGEGGGKAKCSGLSAASSPRKGANGTAGAGGGGGSDDDDHGPQTAGRKGKAAPVSATGDSEGDDTEEERPGSAGGRRGRKRPRVGDVGPRERASHNNNISLDDRDVDDDRKGGGGEEEDDDSEEGAGEGLGAAEMTVAAVRGSLLRSGSDGDREEGTTPNPDREVEEWEVVVNKFIRHVESLPPGPEQEELSLMFAAALDPTLVRMRAANTALVRLAEACCASSSSATSPKPARGGVDDDDIDDHKNGSPEKKLKGAGAPAPGKRENCRYGFKVRLELEATAEGTPPPDGIAGVLRAVAAAAAVVEVAARAEECMAHGGDTLGGLRELRLDYKSSLPPGPSEPIQFIIAEEQARVLGYVRAHEGVLRTACEKVRAAGAKVGDAYRAVQAEAGWAEVKPQVDAFLAKFEGYCESLMPATFAQDGGGVLGLDLSGARDASGSRKAVSVDDDAAAASTAAAAATPGGMEVV